MEQGKTHRVQILKAHLLRLLGGGIREAELAELVQISRLIAESHLRYFRPTSANLCSATGITITDLAYDCIAEIFARDGEGNFHQIKSFAAALDRALEVLPAHEIMLAFKAFVVRVTDAQLARLYAQNDPTGARIHRNLRDCIRQSIVLNLRKDFRGLVVQPTHEDALDNLPPFPIEDLERSFLHHTREARTTAELLTALHKIVVGQSQFRRSMPLFDLVRLLKQVYAVDLPQPSEEVRIPNIENLEQLEIEQIQNHVEIVLKEKILLTYLARGKLNRRQAEAIFGAFHDLITDWCVSGDLVDSLFVYVSNHLPMDEETYETQFRAKMEYLLKITREEFAARLMKEF